MVISPNCRNEDPCSQVCFPLALFDIVTDRLSRITLLDLSRKIKKVLLVSEIDTPR